MRYMPWCLVVLAVVVTYERAWADEWEPMKPTQFSSSKGAWILRVTPADHGIAKPGHCDATLVSVNGKTETQIWSRYLINNYGPVRAMVTDSGRYVVTMDEWGSVGELPVVIYGPGGRLIRVHSTDSLGLKEDVLEIKQTVSSYWWSRDSITFFDADEEVLIIRLHWGKVLLLRLRDGNLMDEDWYKMAKGWMMPEKKWRDLHDYATNQIRTRAVRLLDSGKPGERTTGALVCGQERIKEGIPRLRQLLSDNGYFTTNHPQEWTRVYYVRKAAKEALEALGEKVEGIVIEEPDVSATRDGIDGQH